MIIVSACLCGVNCKYSGGNCLNEAVLKLLKEGKAIPVCPEQLGGLTTPRLPCEIIDGVGSDVLKGTAKIISKDGSDLTSFFLKGAEEALKIGKASNSTLAILKGRSPSCGAGEIYDGTFSGNKIKGNGVAAEMFIQNGFKVFTEEDLDKIEIK